MSGLDRIAYLRGYLQWIADYPIEETGPPPEEEMKRTAREALMEDDRVASGRSREGHE